jgi:hypothetical protein
MQYSGLMEVFKWAHDMDMRRGIPGFIKGGSADLKEKSNNQR